MATFTAGDIQATIGSFAGIALTSWATLLAFKLLFPARADRAAESLETNIWRTSVLGTAFLGLVGGSGLVLIGLPLPLAKIVGLVVIGWVLALSLVGTAGLASLLARRIQDLAPELSPFAAHSRAAAVLVGFSLLPLAGWFVFAPAILAVSAGAGWMAVMARSPREVRA